MIEGVEKGGVQGHISHATQALGDRSFRKNEWGFGEQLFHVEVGASMSRREVLFTSLRNIFPCNEVVVSLAFADHV